jgi:hypothetical protein
VDSSGNVIPIMAGWCQVLVQCAACAAGGVSLAPVTVYIQIHSGSINAPQFTHNGTVATAFSPGNSFFPLSAWHLDIKYFTLWNGVTSSWAGPMMQESNLNSSMIEADPSGTAFGDPAGTSCYSPTWPSSMHVYESAFAVQYRAIWDLLRSRNREHALGAIWGGQPCGAAKQCGLQSPKLLHWILEPAFDRRPHVEDLRI